MKEFQPHDQSQFNPESGRDSAGVPQAQPQREREDIRPLPGALEIIEREVRLYDPALPPVTGEEYSREIDEISRLQEEREENGTPRDHLITDLYWKFISSRGPLDGPLHLEHLTLKEYQEFRSQVEPMTDVQIAEELRALEEARQRQLEEWRERHKNDPPTIAHH